MKTENRLVVADSGWAETLPEWIKEEIKQERLMYGMADILKGTETVGDAEVLAYLYTLNLKVSIDHETGEIFIYLTGKCMKKAQKLTDEQLPDFCREKLQKGLTDQEEYELKILKQKLYRLRGGKINHPLLDVLRELKNRR